MCFVSEMSLVISVMLKRGRKQKESLVGENKSICIKRLSDILIMLRTRKEVMVVVVLWFVSSTKKKVKQVTHCNYITLYVRIYTRF